MGSAERRHREKSRPSDGGLGCDSAAGRPRGAATGGSGSFTSFRPAQAHGHPNAVALVSGEKRWSYGDLDREAGRIAFRLSLRDRLLRLHADVTAFAGHLVRHEREDGLERLVVRRKADGGEHAVTFGEEAYSLELGSPYEFDTRTFRFSYSSPATPKPHSPHCPRT